LLILDRGNENERRLIEEGLEMRYWKRDRKWTV